jgi:hypothetical protein
VASDVIHRRSNLAIRANHRRVECIQSYHLQQYVIKVSILRVLCE